MLYFLHGLNGYTGELNSFIVVFSNYGFSSMAFDFMNGMDLRKAKFMDYVDRIIESINPDDILIGHSMGGLLVQKIAEQTEIKAGVCICPSSPKGIKMQSLSFLSQIRYIPNFIGKVPFKISFEMAYRIFLNGMSEKKARVIYNKMQNQSTSVTYEVFKNKIHVDERKITCPPFFIARNKDQIIPVNIVKRIAEKYNAPLKIYDGSHFIYDDAKIISKDIIDFLKKQGC